jgi:hypothetical protein
MSGLLAPVLAVTMRMVLTPQTLQNLLVRRRTVMDRGENKRTYKPPVMRTNEIPIFLSSGARKGWSIQMGSNRIKKSVDMFKMLAESKTACWLMQVPPAIDQSQ